MILNIIYGFIGLSLLILVHELGHFLVARWANVKVLSFSLGFGKKLLSYKKGDTEYAISAIPLGGYVKMLGEVPGEEIPEEDMSRSYSSKSPLTKILIVFAGPFFNLLFALVLFYFVFLSGYSVLSTKVGSLEKNYPAYNAGIMEGDTIVSIDEKNISEWSDLMDAMAQTGVHPIKIKIKRNGNYLDVTLTPKEIESKNIFGDTIRRKVIGVAAANEFFTKKETVTGAAVKAVNQTYNLTKVTILGIVKLIEGSISPKQVGGPLLILEIAGKQAKEGKKNLIYFIAIISINLGVINLLPIPILDGGHILFHTIELVTRRRLSLKFIEISQKVGMGILVAIMALAFFNDITRMFFGK